MYGGNRKKKLTCYTDCFFVFAIIKKKTLLFSISNKKTEKKIVLIKT